MAWTYTLLELMSEAWRRPVGTLLTKEFIEEQKREIARSKAATQTINRKVSFTTAAEQSVVATVRQHKGSTDEESLEDAESPWYVSFRKCCCKAKRRKHNYQLETLDGIMNQHETVFRHLHETDLILFDLAVRKHVLTRL